MKWMKSVIAAFALCAAALSAHAVGKEDALLAAAKNYGVAEILRLVKEGADVNAKNDEGWTVLMYVAIDNAADAAKALIAAGADVNAKDNNGMTALMYAENNSIKKMIKKAGTKK